MRCERSRRRRLDRGGALVEYIALTVIVATALFVGLQLTGGLTGFVQNGTARGMQKATCILFGDADCATPSTDRPASSNAQPTTKSVQDTAKAPWQDTSKTPWEQATWGDYVALGDSYSSGEGGSEFEEGTDDLDFGCDVSWSGVDCGTGPEKNTCHRSTNAYGQRVSRDVDFQGGYRFAACSGAVIDDFTGARDDQYGEKPQLDQLNEKTSLVTLQVGGNDAHFTQVMTDCVLAGVDPTRHCNDKEQQTRAGIDAVEDDLTDLLKQARKKAPNARIMLVGYPRLFPDPPSGGDGSLGIDSADKRYLNEMAAHLNSVMAKAAENAGGSSNGIEFVDATEAFDGCEIGTDDSCMNGLVLGTIDGKPPVSAGSYHPNDKGQERLAALVERQIREGL